MYVHIWRDNFYQSVIHCYLVFSAVSLWNSPDNWRNCRLRDVKCTKGDVEKHYSLLTVALLF